MSSNEEEPNDAENSLQGLKKRRIQRACDICRRKKIRCDGVQMPGNRCSNCIAYNFECTYVEAAKKRGPPKGYVESLENRLEKMERLIRKLCPDEDILGDLDAVLESEPLRLKPCAPPVSEVMGPRDPRDIATSVIRRVGSPLPPSDELHDDENEHIIIADNLKRLSIDPIDFRFFGKSSGAMLIQTAIELKNEYTGTTDSKRPILGSIRPEFWHPHLWERPATAHEPRRFEFPDEDLLHSLIDLYFKHVNLILPLLHRPTFEREIAEGLHYRNESFGATVLLACAVGSRFSDDPRVLLDGVDTFHSAGWKWFMQVQAIKSSLLAPPSLYDLQFHSLYVQFLQGTSTPQACWTMVGIGVRLAQDVGAHRQNSYSENTAAEGELRKRAVWVLVCLDRMISAALGRPCAIHDEDYDLDMPIECDDEYWYHPDPEQCFKQPPGKPSLVSAFVSFIKLNQVLAFTLRTIYSINKSKILLGFVGQQWEQHIVAELDSALNKWVDSLPDHLRWDPNRENMDFFTQSAVLYSVYYHIQILVHRPFIPSPRRPSTLSFPSLAICTNAARACSHVIDIQRKRGGLTTPQTQMVVFTAGIVLLLNIWGGKRSGLTTDPNREMADVHKCMQALKGSEHKWISVGRLWDILYELAFVGDLPLPKASPPASNKRDRGAESPRSSTPIATAPMVQDGPRSYAGPKRVSSIPSAQIATGQLPPPPSMTQAQNQQQSRSRVTFSLPVYSNELGRLPLHGQSMFANEQSSSSASSLSASDLGYWYPTSASSNVLTPNVTGQMPSEVSTSASSYGSNAISSMFTMPGASVMSYDQSGLNIPSHAQSSSSTSASISMGAVAGSGGQLPSAPFGFDLDQQIDVQQQQIDPSVLERFVPTGADPLDLIDSDTIAMWSSAPTGFELDDWGTYLSNVSELTHGIHHTSEFHPGQPQR